MNEPWRRQTAYQTAISRKTKNSALLKTPNGQLQTNSTRQHSHAKYSKGITMGWGIWESFQYYCCKILVMIEIFEHLHFSNNLSSWSKLPMFYEEYEEIFLDPRNHHSFLFDITCTHTRSTNQCQVENVCIVYTSTCLHCILQHILTISRLTFQ